MPRAEYKYNFSTLEPDKYIAELNREIRDICLKENLAGEDAKQKLILHMLRRASGAAYQGASRLQGGPFGAMIVDFETEEGIPKVVGFGTNHVVPENDPSAHAEMTAIRDAATRLQRTDLSGLTLVTSCECCPMCLSAATGCKMDKIYFGATREDAAKVGFSDADQYRLMKAGGIEQHASKAENNAQAAQWLNGHDAAVLANYNGRQHFYYGDYANAAAFDPTDLPTVQAIKKACRGLSEMLSEANGKPQKVFHLPEDTVLISRDKPHPLSLVAADWARIGRIRGAHADIPEEDSPQKDISRILYLNEKPEAMGLHGNHGPVNPVEPAAIWKEIGHSSAVDVSGKMGHARKVAFNEWSRLVDTGFMPRY